MAAARGLPRATEEPTEPTRLTPDLIDWSRTVAWGEGGYYCRLFLNVEGREPEGVVSPDDYERVRSELKEKLEALGDDQGRPIGTVAHRPEDLYAEAAGSRPTFSSTSATSTGGASARSGTGTVHVFENDTGPDDANHAHEGLYVLVADGVPAGPGPQRALHDVAPTLLELLGEPVPAEMEGQSMLRLCRLASEPESSASRDDSVTDTRTLSR